MNAELTDLESARDRAARFGQLPARILPDDVLETVDTTSRQQRPEAGVSEDQRQLFLAGG